MDFELLPDAAAEIEDAVDFQNDRWGTGDDLRDTIEATIERICGQPKLGRPHKRETRKVVVPGYPYYSVIYVPEAARVLVVAVSHSSRNPDYWLNRLPESE